VDSEEVQLRFRSSRMSRGAGWLLFNDLENKKSFALTRIRYPDHQPRSLFAVGAVVFLPLFVKQS
jgi:hypothetical protein